MSEPRIVDHEEWNRECEIRLLTIEAILIASGACTLEEYKAIRLNCTAQFDQLEARAKENQLREFREKYGIVADILMKDINT